MLLHFHLPQNRKLLWFGLPGALLIGGIAWFLMTNRSAAEQQVGKIHPEMKIARDTEITQIVYYEQCKEQQTNQTKPDDGQIGLTYEEFQTLYPKWNIEMFDDRKIIMSNLASGFCKYHQDHQFIGINGDFVAVYAGTPADRPVLKETTTLKVGGMYPQVLEELKTGIAFRTKEEMLQTLEGLHSR